MLSLVNGVLGAVISFLFLSFAHAGTPLWTFTPDPYYPSTQTVTPINSVVVQYTVTNQSRKMHTLEMDPIAGVTQITSGGSCSLSFTLGHKQSCVLTLLIKGSLLIKNIIGGPIVCQVGSLSQCYQPSLANSLNIILKPVARYVITPKAYVNGEIIPNTPKTLVVGSSIKFVAKPDLDYQVDQWLVDGGIAQKGGSTFILSNIDSNHTVEVSFTRQGTLFVGMENGFVYFSTDNGLNWSHTTVPSSGNSVNSVFATVTTLYVGSADGKVYYSTDNGIHWNVTSTVPGGVNSVFVLSGSPRVYVGSQNGGVYYTDDNNSWNLIAIPLMNAINSIFITPDNTIYAGNVDGNVYYLRNNTSTWVQIPGPNTSSPASVQNVFVSNNNLYINTRNVSSNGTLPPGTVDFEYAYSTSLISSNPTWNLLSQITYSLFVTQDESTLYAGTQDGHVFSLTTGDDLGFITYSPITSVFFIG